MQTLLDVAIALAIALLSILPAVYAIALQSLVSAVEIERRTSSAAVNRFEQELLTRKTGLDEAGLEELQRKLADVRADCARAAKEAKMISAERAFLLPGLLWLAAIGLAAIAKFGDLVPLAEHSLRAAAVLLELTGLFQLYQVLRAAQRFVRSQAPDLRLEVKNAASLLVWKRGERHCLSVAVFNAGSQTARALQAELEVPKSLFWHGNTPWFEPGSPIGTIHTRSFDLKAYNTYGYNLDVTPREPGEYVIQLRAISDEFYGPAIRQKIRVV